MIETEGNYEQNDLYTLFWMRMKYSSQRVWNPVWACRYVHDTVASGMANNRIFDLLRWWHLNSLSLYTVHFCMLIGGDGGKINTVCWMLIEAQIKGRGRVALKGKWLFALKSFLLRFFWEKLPIWHINIPEIVGWNWNIKSGSYMMGIG